MKMEMKMKMTSLESQKAELSSRMSEMQSTISYLREEQRAVESAFQEKQNEMREKYAQMSDQSPEVEALKEELRRKQGEIEDLKLRLQQRGADLGSNATMVEAEATESGGGKSASAETEAITANADRVKDDEAKSKKEDENMKAADDQEAEMQGSPRRFRGKHGYLRRAKGRRWRSVGKQTQVRRSIGASTMADNVLRNSGAEQTHASLEELAQNSETKMEGGHAQENERLGDETTEDKNEHQHNDVLGRKGAAERSAEEKDGRDADESEDKEETDETEF